MMFKKMGSGRGWGIVPCMWAGCRPSGCSGFIFKVIRSSDFLRTSPLRHSFPQFTLPFLCVSFLESSTEG